MDAASANYNSSTSGLPLLNLNPETGKAPDRRIKDAKSGRQMFQNMRWDDQGRNRVRARHQAMLDGEPPYSQALRAAKGQGALTNVNWGDAKNIVDTFMGGILDMKDSVETLMYVPIPRQVVPDDGQRKNLENIVAQEITRAMRMWKGFDQAYLTLGHWFGAHGVGISYFDDVQDWRFQTTGLGDFVIPDGTEASEDAIEVCACLRYEPLHKMYDKIKDPESAKTMGWNVEMVKKAMLQACPENIWNGMPADWQRLEQFIRNNDLGAGYGTGSTSLGTVARTAKVALIHMWVKEFNQTVTKYVTTLDCVPDYEKIDMDEPWLYERPDFYPDMRRGMVFFPYGIGDNGTYHAISGILRAIFPQVGALNRSQCQMIDAAMMGCSMKIQPTTEQSISRMNIIPLGPIWLMPSADHGNVLENIKNPDVAQSVMPVVADLRSTITSRAGQFQGENSPIGSSAEKTKFQVAAELESLGKVGAMQAKLWYASLVWLWRESARRLCNPNYSDKWPGGKEAKAFRDRLVMRGFDLALLPFIDFDGITVNQAVGSGSGAARIGRLESLRELSPEYDDVGRYNLTRDLTAAALGGDYDAANRYMPERPGTRPPVDAQIADLENNLIKLGQEPTIEVNQDNFAHLSRHVPFLGQMIESVEKSEVPLEEIIEPMVLCYYHASDHLEAVEGSMVMQEQVADYRQALQQMGAFVVNAQRKILAEQMREAEKMQEEGAQQGQQMDPALQEKAIAARIKLESMQTEHELQMEFDAQKHQQDMAQKQQKFGQDMAMKDAAKAAELLTKTRQRLADIEVTKKKQDDAIEIAKLKRAQKDSKPKKK